MPFEISSSDKKGWFSLTLFRKSWGRFWPLAVGYGLIQFFMLPLPLFLESGRIGRKNMENWVSSGLRSGTNYAALLGLAFGILAAMALFSYLMNSRSAGMLHALPLRREGLFLTNWVTGLSFFLLPNALVTLLAFAGEGLCGYVSVELTLRWFALHTVSAMFFFCFGVCCAMFTGHILALPVFYGVLNVLVMGLSALIDNALSILLLGYAGSNAMYSDLTVWLTPAWFLHESWIRPVFQNGVGVCVGLTLGTVLYNYFFQGLGAWGFVLLVSLCAVAGAFIGRMFLKKTLRVFAEGWRACVVLGLCMLALLGGARADLFGYQRWTPDPERVESVIITSVSTAPYDDGGRSMHLKDPELIREFVAVHAGAVADLSRMEELEKGGYYYTEDEEGYATAGTFMLRLYYQMDSGREIARKYYAIPIAAGELADPASYAARFQALLNQPELVRQAYLDWMDSAPEMTVTPVGGWLSRAGATEDPTLDYAGANLLWQAFLEDLEAGRIHRYLLDDKERAENCYYTDVNFTLNLVMEDPDGERETRSRDLCVTVQRSATAMMKALEELGMTDLLTQRGEPGEYARGAVTEDHRIYEAAEPELKVVG
ncbi:MAG: ABC transporter permease [Oscillospiraceae bacterium]|nr:ABC transporter permease [Oscillospiraceae bacterium]